MSIASAVDYLKTVKYNYLRFKKQHSILYYKFIKLNPERKEDLKALRKKEILKVKWKKCKLAFDKSRMNSTSEVECLKDGLLIRTSNQFEIERDIIRENSARFTLAHSSPLLQSPLIDKIGLFAEN